MAIFLKPVDRKKQHESFSADQPARPAFRDKTFMIFISVTALFACCFFQIFTNLPVFFKKHLHLSEPFIGLMMAINGIIIALVEMILVYKLEGRRRNLFYITAGVTLVGLSFVLLGIPAHGAFIAFVMIIMITFGEILSMPLMNSYWITRTHTSNRGQYAALYTMAWSAAQTLGPMGGAQLAEHFGFNILWMTVAGISFIAAYAFYRLK